MSSIVHHWILVTSWSLPMIQGAHIAATGLGNEATKIRKLSINSHYAFAIIPDGSKEGWEQSDDGDRARDRFVSWLNEQRAPDGSSPLTWVELAHGECEPTILRHVDMPTPPVAAAHIQDGKP